MTAYVGKKLSKKEGEKKVFSYRKKNRTVPYIGKMLHHHKVLLFKHECEPILKLRKIIKIIKRDK